MKKAIILSLKVMLLTIIMFVSMAVSSAIVGVHSSQSSSGSVVSVLIYSLLNTLVLTLFISKSRLRGLKLVLVTFILFWGIQYFMTQIETLYFNNAVKMPVIDIAKVVVSGAIYAAVFSFLAVLIFGKFKKETDFLNKRMTKISIANMIPTMAILSVIYVIIYFLFGYVVAWQFPALRYYYSGSTVIVNIFQHMSNQFNQDPILFLFQLFRGFFWSILTLMIIYSLDIRKRSTPVIAGLLFSILITTPLIFSNDYMPAPVRLGHSFELSTSMFTYGIIASLIFIRNYSACVFDKAGRN